MMMIIIIIVIIIIKREKMNAKARQELTCFLASKLYLSSWLTLSLPQAIIIGFCKQQRYEPSQLDLRCLTFSLSTLHINVFPNKSLLKKKKADDKCRLKFGAERVNSTSTSKSHFVSSPREMKKWEKRLSRKEEGEK